MTQVGMIKNPAMTFMMMLEVSKSGSLGTQANPATIKVAPTTVNSSASGTGSGLLRETVTVTGTAAA
jgi:hypothetical protein